VRGALIQRKKEMNLTTDTDNTDFLFEKRSFFCEVKAALLPVVCGFFLFSK
jgi:hypothetical protein